MPLCLLLPLLSLMPPAPRGLSRICTVDNGGEDAGGDEEGAGVVRIMAGVSVCRVLSCSSQRVRIKVESTALLIVNGGEVVVVESLIVGVVDGVLAPILAVSLKCLR